MKDCTINDRINTVKNINFNKPKWKKIIHITCEIYQDGGINYRIQLVKSGHPVEEIYKVSFTRKEIDDQTKSLGLNIDTLIETFERIDIKEHADAVEESLNEFEEFLKNYTIESKEKRRKAKVNVEAGFKELERKSRIDKTINLNKIEWKNFIEVTCEIYKDGGIGYEIGYFKKDMSRESILTIALTKEMLESQIVNLCDKKTIDEIWQNLGEKYAKAVELALMEFEGYLRNYIIENAELKSIDEESQKST